MASLWPNGGNKTIWGNIQAKKIFFFSKNTLCHSFRISVIPSVLLSFLPDYCHSFHISVIPSEYCHSFRILSFLPNYYHFKYLSSWIAPVPSHTRKARKMATWWPYMRVSVKFDLSSPPNCGRPILMVPQVLYRVTKPPDLIVNMCFWFFVCFLIQ